MVKSVGRVIEGEFKVKKESEDTPVAPCQGWVNPCEFCDKRFGNWIEASEEDLVKLPSNPGILMVGLKNKISTEIVDIVLDAHDIQRLAYSIILHTKNRVADKKSKITKSVILCRWMIFKQTSDNVVTNLCAHWCNNGTLPKFLKSWPGLDILQKATNLKFSDRLQKWCYPKKEAFWRKPKSLSMKQVEVVQGCDWTKPCEICDACFGSWRNKDDVIAKDLAPDRAGIYMISVRFGKSREVVDIVYDRNSIKLNIRNSLRYYNRNMNCILRETELTGSNIFIQVRWMEFKNPECDKCYFLYAHWLNADSKLKLSTPPGEKILDKNKHFFIRTPDNKWCYEIDDFRPIKTTKFKHKKNILNDLEEDVRYQAV